jgi:hypothetical protein
MDTPYISKDIDRLLFITGSAATFIFTISWIVYGVLLATGQADNDWYPIGHNTIKKLSCCTSTTEDAGDHDGSENENSSNEQCEPEIEGWGGTERRNKYD